MNLTRNLWLLAPLGLLVTSAPACDAEVTSRDRSTDAGEDGRNVSSEAGRDAAGEAGRDAAGEAGRDAAGEAGRDAAGEAGRDGGEPFAPAAGCTTPPDGGALDAAVRDSAVDSDVDAAGCVDCQPAYVTRFVGTLVTVTDTYPACCAEDQGSQTCGVSLDGQCVARQQAGTLALACPDRCCRVDGMCGVRTTSPAIGCFASKDPQPVTCRSAAGPHPGACACASCSAEIAKCSGSESCAAVVACRAGRTSVEPADAEGYALADALDSCLARAGCARLPEVGLCREPCPSGWAGGVLVLVNLIGCCRTDGFCGVGNQNDCILYDDPPLSGAPRSLSGPPPTCHAAALAHPDGCACESCEDALLECARDGGCVAISECRVQTGCSAAACDLSTACAAVIAANGGAQGNAAVLAAAVESCLGSVGCETRQFGVCK